MLGAPDGVWLLEAIADCSGLWALATMSVVGVAERRGTLSIVRAIAGSETIAARSAVSDLSLLLPKEVGMASARGGEQ